MHGKNKHTKIVSTDTCKVGTQEHGAFSNKIDDHRILGVRAHCDIHVHEQYGNLRGRWTHESKFDAYEQRKKF